MPKNLPRRDVLRKLKVLGYEGPYSGGKHTYMQKGRHAIVVPNPHRKKDLGPEIVGQLLKELGMSWTDFKNI